MKLQCQVEVVHRLYGFEQKSGRFVKSILVIDSKPKKVDKFIVHFSTETKTRYKVKYLTHIFDKFINEGTATLRFEEPLHDLYVKCEATQLKFFVKLLKFCDCHKTQMSNFPYISETIKDQAPTILHIYDHRTNLTKDLPHTLETLCIKGIQMYRFPKEVLNLKSLHYLVLSNNNIERIPEELGNLTLRELCLANNQLGTHNDCNWKWFSGNELSSTLKLLDLSGNEIVSLPNAICRLQQLITLRLGDNKLKNIPGSMGRLKNLRYLVLTKNYLRSLPASLLEVKLDELDISSQITYRDDEDSSRIRVIIGSLFWNLLHAEKSLWDLQGGTLLNICAKTILSQNIHDYKTLPNILIDLLDNMNLCMCGKSIGALCTLTPTAWKTSNYFKRVIADRNSSYFLFDCYLCRLTCYNKQNWLLPNN